MVKPDEAISTRVPCVDEMSRVGSVAIRVESGCVKPARPAALRDGTTLHASIGSESALGGDCVPLRGVASGIR
jgi:hypothetical protein